MLVTKALEDPLRRVTLLLRTVLILRQDLLNDTGERVELGPDPHIAGRHRETEHLLHCPLINPKMTSRFPLGSAHRSSPRNAPAHTNPLALSPALLSDAQRAIADGILLRRNQTIRPLQ